MSELNHMLRLGELLKYEKNPRLQQTPTGKYHLNEGLKVKIHI